MKTCTKHWKYQRVSGALLGPLGLWFIYILVTTPHNYGAQLSLIQSPFVRINMVLLAFIMFYHAHRGLCEIFEDYISNASKWQRISCWAFKMLGVVVLAGSIL